MICDFSDDYLIDLLSIQLKIFKITKDEIIEVNNILPKVKNRVQFSFSHSKNKYYKKNGEVYFNPFHSGQWTIFLYYLSNSLYKKSKDNCHSF